MFIAQVTLVAFYAQHVVHGSMTKHRRACKTSASRISAIHCMMKDDLRVPTTVVDCVVAIYGLLCIDVYSIGQYKYI